MTFAEFLALPLVPEQYTSSVWEKVRTQTQRSVSLEGYIAEVMRAADGATYGRPREHGDFHVHLPEAKVARCWPDGPQNQQIVTEITPHFQSPRTGWSYETLRDLCQRQVRVRISGWLLHDYAHLKDVGDWRASGSGRRGARRSGRRTEENNRLVQGSLDLSALESPHREASRVKLIAVQSERRIESSELDLHIHFVALHRLATNWARQSAPTMSANNALSRA